MMVINLGDTLINVENISLITINIANEEVIIADENGAAPAAKIMFYANGGAYEMRFDSVAKAQTMYQTIAALTKAQAVQGNES